MSLPALLIMPWLLLTPVNQEAPRTDVPTTRESAMDAPSVERFMDEDFIGQDDSGVPGMTTEAADAFLESIKVEDLLDQARNALNADQYPEAAAAYAVAADRLPRDERLQYNLGVAAYRAGDLDTARRAFELSSNSSNPELTAASLFNRGNVAYRSALAAIESAQAAQTLRGRHKPRKRLR